MDINEKMRTSSRLKRVLSLIALTPVLVALTSCANTIKLDQKEDNLAQKTVTQGGNIAIYPDDDPSVPDGKVVWQQQNCASCHGATGKGGSASVDLTNLNWERERKPIDQFMFLRYGTPNHEALKDKLATRQIWNLVFYTRSMAQPFLSDSDPEFSAIDAVFGSNCAVCHGKKGYGDGPLAHNLEPSPANFQRFDRFYDRTDAILWDHIANGIKWEGMPNFRGKTDKSKNPPVKFDDAYIWKLVQYVRRFHESGEATVAVNPGADKPADGTPAKAPIR